MLTYLSNNDFLRWRINRKIRLPCILHSDSNASFFLPDRKSYEAMDFIKQLRSQGEALLFHYGCRTKCKSVVFGRRFGDEKILQQNTSSLFLKRRNCQMTKTVRTCGKLYLAGEYCIDSGTRRDSGKIFRFISDGKNSFFWTLSVVFRYVWPYCGFWHLMMIQSHSGYSCCYEWVFTKSIHFTTSLFLTITGKMEQDGKIWSWL